MNYIENNYPSKKYEAERKWISYDISFEKDNVLDDSEHDNQNIISKEEINVK